MLKFSGTLRCSVSHESARFTVEMSCSVKRSLLILGIGVNNSLTASFRVYYFRHAIETLAHSFNLHIALTNRRTQTLVPHAHASTLAFSANSGMMNG